MRSMFRSALDDLSISRCLALLVFVAVGALAPVAARTTCVSASIPDPIRLPDGSIHAPGALTLCISRTLSPVAHLHEIYVDGMPVGLHASRKGYSEGSRDSQPFMMFNRGPDGRLNLYGFAVSAGDRMITYYMRPSTGTNQQLFAKGSAPPAEPMPPARPNVLLSAQLKHQR